MDLSKFVYFVIYFISSSFLELSTAGIICNNLIKNSELSDNPSDVGFYLFPDAANSNHSEELKIFDLNSFKNSSFDPAKNLIMIVHGFSQNLNSDCPVLVKDAYLAAGYANTTNIISVDWGYLSGANASSISVPVLAQIQDMPLYGCAVGNVRTVGERIGQFLTFLVSNNLTSHERIHLVGQSLGAHTVGVAGEYFKTNTSTLVARITATDPARPLFFLNPFNTKNVLSKDDAEFVDVIHTNIGGFGYPTSIGHADFYVNGGGPLQPACGLHGLSIDLFCAHNLAPKFFANSIGPPTKALRADRPCFLWVMCFFRSGAETTFGENCPRTASGDYYIDMTP